MKKIFLLGFALVLCMACQNKPERFTTSSTNIDEVKALVSDYNSGNWDSWATHYADTAKIHHNTWKNGVTPAEMQESLKGLLANVSSYGFHEEPIFYEQTLSDDGFTWVNFWANWKGTLSANGQEIEIPVHLSCKMANGKIADEYGFYDLSEYWAAMKAIEAENNLPVDEKALLSTIKNMVTIWNKNDQEQMKAISVPNLIRNANGARIANNQDEYAAMMTSFFTGFPDFKVILEDTSIKGNKATITWRCVGTNTGEFVGNAPTNKKVNVPGISVWSFNGDGKAIQEDAFFDNLTMFNQLGLPAPTN